MPLIYITGPSGAGKSTVRRELTRRGYEAHDTDEDNISAWYDNQTLELVGPRPPSEKDRPADWYKKHDYRMATERIEEVAERATNTFGKSPDELKLMLYWHSKMLERYKEWGATMVDASQPLDTVVAAILAEVAGLFSAAIWQQYTLQ